MRLQSDLSVPLAAEGERPATAGGTVAISGAIAVLLVHTVHLFHSIGRIGQRRHRDWGVLPHLP